MYANFLLAGTSPAAAGAAVLGSTAGSGDLSRYSKLLVTAELIGATGGTLDVIVEHSPDAGTTWYEYGRFVQLAGSASARIAHVATAPGAAAFVAVGKVTTTTATTFTMTGDAGFVGQWHDRMRVRCVAGSGTSAGAALKIHLSFSNPT